MKIYTTVVFFTEGPPVLMDTIEHEGSFWLVTKWLPSRDVESRKPERLIRLTTLPHQSFSPGQGPHGSDFALNVPLSKAVADGQSRSQAGLRLEILDADQYTPPTVPTVH